MKPDRWREVSRIYGAVLTRPESDRPAVLADLCANDQELRREVESLLASGTGAALLDRVAGDRPSVMAMAQGVAVGSRIGVFEIQSLLGVGGMGEVYRARDTKLNRDVAIKILPAAFASDPDRLARFKREAQVLASLNHPNIGGIYGFEDANALHALVLELVEGPTLADRIARGALPVDEALTIARQIADALEVAHEQGIVHRDLKPANIKVRDDGTVKVLDFGLAKFSEPPSPESRAPSLSQSPTITTPAMTAAGMILGTAAYMSPEQAKGRPADRRSDIWAFGCVLYEMLSGRRPFEGDDISDTLAAILRAEPDWSRLPADLPASIRTLLKQCLTKDLAKRPSHIAVARFLLSDAAAGPEPVDAVTANPQARSRNTVGWVMAAALLVVATAIGLLPWLRREAVDHPVSRFTITLPDAIIGAGTRPLLNISRDGSQIVYAAGGRLYLRTLSDLQPRPIAGTEFNEGINSPVFSPDGQWIVFYTLADNTIKRIAATGGTAVTVCPATSPFGLSWDDDWLVYGEARNGVMRVAPKGGKPERLVAVTQDEIPDSPQVLPGGQDVLFAIGKGLAPDRERWDNATIVVQSLTTGVRTPLIKGGSGARYVSSGHLLYAVSGTLLAVPFDLRQMKVVGTPTPVIEGVRRSISAGGGGAHFSVSAIGTLIYLPGPAHPFATRSIAIVDRHGTVTPLPLPVGAYIHPRVSPDGDRLAVEKDDGPDANIWIYDLSRANSLRRLSFSGHNRWPIWSEDAKRVAFQSDRDGDFGIYAQRADGAGGGGVERLTKAAPGESHIPESWSPDGRTLLFSVRKDDRFRVYALSLNDKTVRPFGGIESAEPPGATFSPDGAWVAYGSNLTAGGTRSSDRGIYVQPFPETGDRYQIPKERLDFHPTWASRSELVYTPTVGRFSAVSVQVKPEVVFGAATPIPMPVSHDRVSTDVRDSDVFPDGRLIVTTPGGESRLLSDAGAQIQIVLNWFDELRTRVPVK